MYRGGNVEPIPFSRRTWDAAMCGVAMLVPSNAMKSGFVSQNAYVEVIETPGALMSGFSRPSPEGPRLLKLAIASSPRATVFRSSTAPTERMLKPAPGSPTVRAPGPEFPAAIATGTPSPSITASKNRSHAVSPMFVPPPKLRLTTSAPAVRTAQSTPDIPSVGYIAPPPKVVSQPAFTLISWSSPYATPRYVTSLLATVPATWVPWLWRSSGFVGLSL